MTCAEFEVLLCDYLDETLPADRRREVEQHRAECASCAAFAKDVSGAVAFLGRVEAVEPPAELLTRITFEIPTGGARKEARGWLLGPLLGWLQPILQPRFAMGMAMTILSFSMLGRLAGIEVRQLKPSDLQPANVWAATEDRAHRMWARAVKYYDNLRLVYEVQARLQEWTRQEEEDRKGRPGEEGLPAAEPRGNQEERK
jgi:hypothetical protein